MGARTRKWTTVATAAALGVVVGLLAKSGDWGLLEIYAGLGVALLLLVPLGNLWIDSAHDGPMRHRKRR